VIVATGYSVEIPPVENGTLIPVHENETMLYKYMYPIETSDHNTFAVIGLLQVQILHALRQIPFQHIISVTLT
jgi:hypothetical protein